MEKVKNKVHSNHLDSYVRVSYLIRNCDSFWWQNRIPYNHTVSLKNNWKWQSIRLCIWKNEAMTLDSSTACMRLFESSYDPKLFLWTHIHSEDSCLIWNGDFLSSFRLVSIVLWGWYHWPGLLYLQTLLLLLDTYFHSICKTSNLWCIFSI